jgi:hypothetical protein
MDWPAEWGMDGVRALHGVGTVDERVRLQGFLDAVGAKVTPKWRGEPYNFDATGMPPKIDACY